MYDRLIHYRLRKMRLQIVAVLCTATIVNGFPKPIKIDENLIPPEINEIPFENVDEPKGFFQSIGDSVKGYFADKVKDLFKSVKVECKSKINKSGKLTATKTGKTFCQTRCREIYAKIDSARETINWLKSHLPIGNGMKLKSREAQNLPEYRCAPNLLKNKLLCDCPQAPEFSFSKSVEKYLQSVISSPSMALRKDHYYYNNGYGPYGGYHGGYGGYHGSGYYSNPFAELLSMIFYPLKILFFLVTLPFWIFLIFFIGMELEDIFD